MTQNATIRLTVFDRSPDGGRGLARDTRVRWALEEVGQPYTIRAIPMPAMAEPAYLAQHPFGQIPLYEQGDLVLFETGAIILHIAETFGGLLPADPAARARTITWMFAALNTVEPPILDLTIARLVEGDRPWAEARLPLVRARIQKRLAQFSTHLRDKTWIEAEFTASDLLMVSVLQRVQGAGFLAEFPNLEAYVARGHARPAYVRAFRDQHAWNTRGE